MQFGSDFDGIVIDIAGPGSAAAARRRGARGSCAGAHQRGHRPRPSHDHRRGRAVDPAAAAERPCHHRRSRALARLECAHAAAAAGRGRREFQRPLDRMRMQQVTQHFAKPAIAADGRRPPARLSRSWHPSAPGTVRDSTRRRAKDAAIFWRPASPDTANPGRPSMVCRGPSFIQSRSITEGDRRSDRARIRMLPPNGRASREHAVPQEHRADPAAGTGCAASYCLSSRLLPNSETDQRSSGPLRDARAPSSA